MPTTHSVDSPRAVSRPLRWYWRRRRAMRVVAAVAVGLAGAAVLLWLLIKVLPPDVAATHKLDPAQRAEEIGRVRTALLAGTAGLIAATGAAFTLLSYFLTRSAQITDRFSRAVEQLGSDKKDVAVGGIFALERIAKDSPKDHLAVVELLTEYVRLQAPWVRGKDWTDDPCGADAADADSQYDPFIRDRPEFERPAGRAPVQAAMKVLGRRDRRNDVGQLELRSTDLRLLDLDQATLQEAKLSRSNLARIWMHGARLEAASMSDACLDDAALNHAHLERARLKRTRLRRAWLAQAHLEGAILEEAHLQGADLRGASLENAVLTNAHLDGADLRGARLRGATFKPASLEDMVHDSTTEWPSGYRPPPSGPVRHHE